MTKDYQISNDGTIFRIKEDGSIFRIAKINNKGKVENISDPTEVHETSKVGYWIIIFLLVTTAVILGILYSSTTNELNNISNECVSTNKELSEANALLNELSSEYPFIITDIKIGNIDFEGNIETNYGDKIYSHNTMYLAPQLSYIGVKDGLKTLKVKLYTPSGILSTGDLSPSGYTISEDRYISKGKNYVTLSGWGGDTRGHWGKGTYRYEIWFDNKCIMTHYFKIH